MNKKTEIAVIVVMVVLAITAYFVITASRSSKPELLVPTPVEGDSGVVVTAPTQVTVPGNRVTIQWDQGSEELIFFNFAGYTFKSYIENGVTDKVAVLNNGAEIMQLGVNLVGYTQGSIPLSKLVKVQTSYLGDLYREINKNTSAVAYYSGKATNLMGICTGNGDDVKAPCAITDQLYGPNEVFSYLVTCNDVKYVTKCDDIMKGLKIL